MYFIVDVGLNLPDLQGGGDHPIMTILANVVILIGIAEA